MRQLLNYDDQKKKVKLNYMYNDEYVLIYKSRKSLH